MENHEGLEWVGPAELDRPPSDTGPSPDNPMNGLEFGQRLRTLAAGRHDTFTTDEAAACGVSLKRIRSAVAAGQVTRLAHRVYAFAPNGVEHRQVLMAATLLGGMASHGSAAHLQRLARFEETDRIDVSFPRGRRPKIAGAMVHTWRHDHRDDITTIDGIRCTSIARTLAQLGAVADRDTVEAALDSALDRGVKLDWIERTLDRLRRPGVTGSGSSMTSYATRDGSSAPNHRSSVG